MQCCDPVLCYIKLNGKKVYRNFSLADQTVKKYAQHIFDCGKCLPCRKAKAYELAVRCTLHSTLYDQNMFVTLTYDEKKEGYHNNFQYRDIQLFKKNLRQYAWRKHGRRIEIFNVHEYGKKGKKHWHLIVFNFQFPDQKIHASQKYFTSEKLKELWPHGDVHSIGSVTLASAMYQAQYMEKDFKNGYVTTNKKCHSKHSGLGRPYFMKHYSQLLRLGYIPMEGKKVALPRYFEKLAHKHWAHFYDQSYFHDTIWRKQVHRPFKKEKPNKEIADFYIGYKKRKEEMIKEKRKQWDDIISHHLTTKERPDFIKSGENILYDLKNKIGKETF